MKRYLGLAFGLGLVCAISASAKGQEANTCDKFKWNLAREKAWFSSTPPEIVPGTALPAVDRAYRVSLKPGADTHFVLRPQKEPKPQSFAAVLTFATIEKPGLYEITLSDAGWIDAIQNGERMNAVDFTGQANCPGLHKSVRFYLTRGPLTLQISNVDKDSILLAIAGAE